MRLRWLGVPLGIVLCCGWVWAQPVTSTTVVVQQGLAQQYGQIIERIPPGSVEVQVSAHPDAAWLEQEFLQQVVRNDRSIVTSGGRSVVRLVFADVSTRYESIEQTDSVRRVVTVDVGATIQQEGSTIVVPSRPLADTVVMLRQDASAAQSTQHTSTHAELPLPERTVWDDVLEPAIFVVAAVATVVLLFTVRSQ